MGFDLPGSLPSYIHCILSSIFLCLIKIVVVLSLYFVGKLKGASYVSEISYGTFETSP